MAARPENNPRHYLITLGALGVFCLFFMVLFRVEKAPKNEDPQNAPHNLFQMIPHGATKNQNILDQARADNLDIAELSARDELDDPTLMSFPNKKYGFSVVRKEKDEPPKPQIEEYVLPVMNVDAPLIDRTPLVGIFPEPSANDTGNLTAPSITTIETPELNKALVDRIVWLEDMVEAKSPFKAEDAKKAAAGKVPTARTEVRIEKLSTSPVLFLVQKSGIPALDSLVMNNLRSRLLKVFVGEIQSESLPDSVIVDWRLILRENKNP